MIEAFDSLWNKTIYHPSYVPYFADKSTPNIYDSDDDNDGIPTSVEIQNHLDPFYFPDGKEIHGYKVKIITGWSNGQPISRMRFISPSELDPLTPYTNAMGAYLDTDSDGIPDVVEAWFSNSSIVTSYEYILAWIYCRER